ncbi:MAG: glucose 1-dehydrogenase [Myxococcota bacterium]|nr:glucose 1-dehydrogenase [Myxococcota bacterium]
MAERLAERVAIVTGGASGLGEATVRLFVEEGARVLVADLQDEPGEALAAELGPRAHFLRTDVSREEDVAAAVDRAVADWERLDCFFANAGIVGAVGPIDQIPAAEYDATMAVLLRGAFLGMKHAARVMKPQRSGTILCTSSVAGLEGGLGPHVYATAKAALLGLTRSAAAELAAYGIRVNCIAPGNMATPMVADVMAGDPDAVPAVERGLAKHSPLRGRAGLAQDIAEAALWLASDAAGYVSGHTLVVDGGLTSGSANRIPELFEKAAPMIRERGGRGL